MDNKKRLGVALCGSYCTYEQVFRELEKLAGQYDLVPIMSDTAAETDTRFGSAADHIRHLMDLTGKRVVTTIAEAEPLGPKTPMDALIIAPWNYPFQLLVNPLVGAISAGCTAVLKPSPYVPNVSRVIEEMISQTFDERYIAVVQGNRDVNTQLLAERWDIIFFTGSPALGHLVMEAAAKYLTPVVLELGGKSPCIITADADLKLAAKRLAWGKALNAGQTCIAGNWNDSARYLNGVFFGARNRLTQAGCEWEDPLLPDALFDRLRRSYEELDQKIHS